MIKKFQEIIARQDNQNSNLTKGSGPTQPKLHTTPRCVFILENLFEL
jgi:hypothetical protein